MTCSLHTGFVTLLIQQLKLAKSTALYGWTHGLCFMMMHSRQMLGDLMTPL
jgi:hypothetical protein